ncbi:IS66 family insertion sequence element accessory protein TnpA [Sorangium sp. So ce394]|uniref:IS66 family insertion sequence element accessory protein TnpA n=1 Tax=Sorangium sp. So ce394 TaxID=3133310 RepID=UPI003F5B9FE3
MATRAEWAERVERWERSGLSAEKFARREGYKPKQLYWWRWKLRADRPSQLSPPSSTEQPRFLPVHVVADVSPVMTEPIEIALPNVTVQRHATSALGQSTPRARSTPTCSTPSLKLFSSLKQGRTTLATLCRTLSCGISNATIDSDLSAATRTFPSEAGPKVPDLEWRSQSRMLLCPRETAIQPFLFPPRVLASRSQQHDH